MDNTTTPQDRYRVIVWGPGYTGAQALREISRRPELELVGCFGYSPTKVGRDTGELIGQSPSGVRITDDISEILAVQADAVLYAGRALPDESSRHAEITALLASGKNVATTTAYFFPWQHGEDYVGPLERACAEGGTTLHGTGVHPGWFVERFALTSAALCTSVNSIVVRELCDLSHHAGEAISGIGFGRRPEQLGSKTRKALLSRYYFESIAGLAHHLGFALDDITADIRYRTGNRRLECAGATIEPGTVGCVDGTWQGRVAGKPVITIREVWYLDPELIPADIEVSDTDVYEVEVDGLPIGVQTRAVLATTDRRDVTGVDDQQSPANLATAVQLVQTVPAVVAAPPGILLAPGFAYPARDLRNVAAPLAQRPRAVREIIH